MADQTTIEWCDSTFNPWIGCTRVSPACDDCYAARSTPARTLGVQWGAGAQRHRTSAANWALPLRWQREAGEFFAQHGRRRRVFCASLADWLDNEAPIEWLVALLELIRSTPDLDWLLLTKRIGNWRARLAEAHSYCAWASDSTAFSAWVADWINGKAPRNVWIGATVINQAEYDRDIGKLLRIQAAVHYLSVEPMLGPIDMRMGGASAPDYAEHRPLARLDWVICGGESGPKARPMHIEWARDLMQQCKDAGVAFHMKQLGAHPRGWCAAQVHADPAEREDDACDFYEAHELGAPCPGRCAAMVDKKGGDMAEWPEDLRVREFPKESSHG